MQLHSPSLLKYIYGELYIQTGKGQAHFFQFLQFHVFYNNGIAQGVELFSCDLVWCKCCLH